MSALKWRKRLHSVKIHSSRSQMRPRMLGGEKKNVYLLFPINCLTASSHAGHDNTKKISPPSPPHLEAIKSYTHLYIYFTNATTCVCVCGVSNVSLCTRSKTTVGLQWGSLVLYIQCQRWTCATLTASAVYKYVLAEISLRWTPRASLGQSPLVMLSHTPHPPPTPPHPTPRPCLMSIFVLWCR